MLETIQQDLNRLEKDGIFSEEEMQKYIAGQAESAYKTINTFLLPDKDSELADKYTIGYTLFSLLILRHLPSDFISGYINISREDISKFNLNIRNLFDGLNFKNWFSYKVSMLSDDLTKKVHLIKNFPLKLKLYWFWVFPYSYKRILRIRNYNYDFREMKNKKLLRELEIYFLTFIYTVRFFPKIFF
jgi:hypothetical protein